jgi:hypothetical protein
MKVRRYVTHAFCQLMREPRQPQTRAPARKTLVPEDREERRYFIAGVLFAFALPAPFAWLIITYFI